MRQRRTLTTRTTLTQWQPTTEIPDSFTLIPIAPPVEKPAARRLSK